MNNRFSSVQKQLTTFLKAKSAPSKVIGLLNQFGIAMSYHWSTTSVNRLSKSEIETFQKHLKGGGRVFLIYDNIRLTFRKETQRVNNQTHGDNGTSVTAVKLPEGAANIFRNYRELNAKKQEELRSNLPCSYRQLTYADLIIPEQADYLLQYTYSQVINILFECPEFEGYEYANFFSNLQPPTAVHQLPTGKAHKTEYWQLASWPIEESSYEGNDLVLTSAMKVMNGKPLSVEEEAKFAEGAIPVACDQLTFSLDSRLKLMRSNCRNSFDRLSWLLLSPGFFHVELNLANAILHNHRGTHASYGFARDISKIGIKGLAADAEKPYFHTVDDLLKFELTARIRSLWLWVSGAESIQHLRKELDSIAGASRIRGLAERIVKERASTSALDDLDDSGKSDDKVLRQLILMCRDLLLYQQLRETIRSGDVGHIEYMLPELAIFFKGSGSKNYSQLLLDYLQWSRFEAPDGVRYSLGMQSNSNGFAH